LGPRPATVCGHGQLASDYVVLGLADLFQAAGLEGIFAELIRKRIGHSCDTRLLDWLIDYEMAGERFQSALARA
jgi:hypothetical protein